MNKTRDNSAKHKILPQPRDFVKGLIVSAGIPMGRLADAAKISQSALSNYLAGIRKDRATQLMIWDAFCRLSGQKISLADFWGELLSERIAG